MWKLRTFERAIALTSKSRIACYTQGAPQAKPFESDDHDFSYDTSSQKAIKETVPKAFSSPLTVSRKLEIAAAPEYEIAEAKTPTTFDDMPGPVVLKYLSKVWNSIPLISNHVTASTMQYYLNTGTQLAWFNNFNLFRHWLNEYGPLVRLHGPLGGDVVIVSRPEHASIVFENEGQYPIRSSLECVEKYRLQHRQYKHAGPFSLNGPHWQNLREIIEPAIETTLNSHYYKISNICDDFVIRVNSILNRQLEVPDTFRDELSKWSLECLCTLMFNRNLGFLDPHGLSPSSETSVLFESLNDATSAIKKCEFGFHLWKLLETPNWKKLVQNCDTIDHILGIYIKKTQDIIRERMTNGVPVDEVQSDGISLIECFLVQEKMSAEDILTVLLDMLLIGVNTTTHSAGFLMYHLARHPRHQYLCYKEVQDMPDTLGKSEYADMIYTKACLLESLRLKPPMPVLNRILTKDVTIHGYHIPKGTNVLLATNLSSLREEHFEDAQKFKPERWLEETEFSCKSSEGLASIPFGFGPKQCIAKELAKTQICFLIAKILRKFRIEYHYGDIESNNCLLAAPKRPFKFRLVERN